MQLVDATKLFGGGVTKCFTKQHDRTDGDSLTFAIHVPAKSSAFPQYPHENNGGWLLPGNATFRTKNVILEHRLGELEMTGPRGTLYAAERLPSIEESIHHIASAITLTPDITRNDIETYETVTRQLEQSTRELPNRSVDLEKKAAKILMKIFTNLTRYNTNYCRCGDFA